MKHTPSFASQVALAPHTTMGVGGKADYFHDVADIDTLRAALHQAKQNKLPMTILGGGSNVIIADQGIRGLVLRFVGNQIRTTIRGDKVELWVQAGCLLDDLIQQAVAEHWAGITCLSGIPGWCGACPIQNVGAYGREIGQVLIGVEVVALQTGKIYYIPQAELQLQYRDSIFKQKWRHRFLITTLHLALTCSQEETVAYPELQRLLGGSAAPLSTIRQAVLALRASKGMLMEPNGNWLPSCGSFFTNPVVSQAQVTQLQQRYPGNLPHWPIDHERIKLSAAWLVEQAGFPKGWQASNHLVGISPKHALCLVNLGQATSQAIVQTAEQIRQQVWQQFAILLSPEPEHLGFDILPYTMLAQ